MVVNTAKVPTDEENNQDTKEVIDADDTSPSPQEDAKGTNENSSNKEEQQIDVTPGSNCCSGSGCSSLTIDIVSTVCLYLMSIFFIAGSGYLLPRNYIDRPKEIFLLWFFGVAAYITTTIIELFKRRSKGALQIVMSSLAIAGGTFWFVGSIFLIDRIQNFRVWSILWILGSLLNLASVTFDIVLTFVQINGPKPFFRSISLGLSWIANLLLLGGAAHIAKELTTLTFCDLSNAGGALLSGSIIYLIHSIFHTLGLFKKRVLFSIQFSQDSPS
jgi:hypothetical protein